MTETEKGKFIVFEGLDLAGKTTLARMLVRELARTRPVIYRKGLCSPTWPGNIAGKRPSTFLFLLEAVYLCIKNRRAREQGITVVQDRYLHSLACHKPIADRLYNIMLTGIAAALLPRPDMLICCTVAKDERIKRLAEDEPSVHHRWLIDHPDHIDIRDRAYREKYAAFPGAKIVINTTKTRPETSLAEILNHAFFN